MTINVIPVDYNAPQQLYRGTLDAGQDVSYAIPIPADATPGAIGSISVDEGGDSAPYQASLTLTTTATDFVGHYQLVEQTYYIQIAGGQHPRQDALQVSPGTSLYVNATLAHNGKTGHGPKSIALQLRKPQ